MGIEITKEMRDKLDNEVMTIEGGLEGSTGKRYKDGKAPLGRKVVYLDKNGMDGDRYNANKIFKEGQVLEVKEIYVGSSRSMVEFGAYPNEFFNTVMFGDVEETI